MVKIPNRKKESRAHHDRTALYQRKLERLYSILNLEAAQLAESTNYDVLEQFRFQDYPETRAGVDKLIRKYRTNLSAIVVNGVTAEWGEANFCVDRMVQVALKAYGVKESSTSAKKYFGNNQEALKAFITRKDNGLGLSDKVWQLSSDYREGLETAISTGVEKGMDAMTLSKRISKYLHDYPQLKDDYKEKFGQATDILDCEYRSARLVRTEINMAYRTADQERWDSLDFVIGFEVKRSGDRNKDKSGQYACPLCGSLVGKYPKDFKFVGWHPNCRCYTIPILKTEEEFWAYDGRSEETSQSGNEVKNPPEGFDNYVTKNRNRIDQARRRGTLPYFMRDNERYVSDKLRSNNSGDQSYRFRAFDYEDLSSVEDVLSEYYRQWSDDLPHGVSQVLIKDLQDNQKYFMATNCYGKFTINNVVFGNLDNFNPALDLLDAFNTIKRGGDLSFKQEYSLESLWHEILHNKTYAFWGTTMSGAEEVFNEALHQFIARHQYPKFIERLGGKAINQTEIKKLGYGYRKEVSRLNYLLDRYDVDSTHFAEVIGDDYLEKPKELYASIINYMAKYKKMDKEFVHTEFFEYITRIKP